MPASPSRRFIREAEEAWQHAAAAHDLGPEDQAYFTQLYRDNHRNWSEPAVREALIDHLKNDTRRTQGATFDGEPAVPASSVADGEYVPVTDPGLRDDPAAQARDWHRVSQSEQLSRNYAGPDGRAKFQAERTAGYDAGFDLAPSLEHQAEQEAAKVAAFQQRLLDESAQKALQQTIDVEAAKAARLAEDHAYDRHVAEIAARNTGGMGVHGAVEHVPPTREEFARARQRERTS